MSSRADGTLLSEFGRFARGVVIGSGLPWLALGCGRLGYEVLADTAGSSSSGGTGGKGALGSGGNGGGITTEGGLGGDGSSGAAPSAGGGGNGGRGTAGGGGQSTGGGPVNGGGAAGDGPDAAPGCGNGVLEPGEQCDDGAQTAGCDADCTLSACGDGVVNGAAGEQCDQFGGQSALCDVAGSCGPDCLLLPASVASACAVCEVHLGHRYSFCQVADWPASDASCRSMGARLTRLDDTSEAAYVRHTSTWAGHAQDWIGGQATTPDEWRWSDGAQFWQGGPLGARVGGLYVNWDDDYPGALPGDCAFLSFRGVFQNDRCTGPATPHHYVCETYHTAPPSCGNGALDPGESCDDNGDSARCDADCTLPSCGDGHLNTAAGEGCDGGGSDLACPSTCVKPSRVTTDLVALYTFGEGLGTKILDTSSFGAALDLTIGVPQFATWNPAGGLALTGPAQIVTSGPATKILDACKATNALSVEVWVATTTYTQTNRSLLALSVAPSDRAFRLSQQARTFAMDVRTTNTGSDGGPPLSSADMNSGELTHLVYMLSPAGPQERFYVDGVELGTGTLNRTAAFSPWPAAAALWLGDEPGGVGADFHGTVRLVAIYSRALSLAEVSTNYFAGPP